MTDNPLTNLEAAAQEYLEVCWRFLIRDGAVTTASGKWNDDVVSYYSGTLNTDKDQTRRCLAGIQTHGIDWSKTTDPGEQADSAFNGTFTSTQLKIKYLKGNLVLNNGETYTWVTANSDLTFDFGAVVRLLTSGKIPTMLEAIKLNQQNYLDTDSAWESDYSRQLRFE